MGPFNIFRLVVLIVAAVISLLIIPRARRGDLRPGKRRPLSYQIPVEPLTDNPLVTKTLVPQRRPQQRSVAWTMVVIALVVSMLAMSLIPYTQAGAWALFAVGVLAGGAAWYFFSFAKNAAIVDEKSATVITDWRGRSTILIHTYLTGRRYHAGKGVGRGGSLTLHTSHRKQPYRLSLAQWDLTNLVAALALLEAEGRFAPERIKQAGEDRRRQWLVSALNDLENATGEQMSPAFRQRLMEGPLIHPDQFGLRSNTQALVEYTRAGQRAWWSPLS